MRWDDLERQAPQEEVGPPCVRAADCAPRTGGCDAPDKGRHAEAPSSEPGAAPPRRRTVAGSHARRRPTFATTTTVSSLTASLLPGRGVTARSKIHGPGQSLFLFLTFTQSRPPLAAGRTSRSSAPRVRDPRRHVHPVCLERGPVRVVLAQRRRVRAPGDVADERRTAGADARPVRERVTKPRRRLATAPGPVRRREAPPQSQEREQRVLCPRHAGRVGVEPEAHSLDARRLDPAHRRAPARVVTHAGRVGVDERGVVGRRLLLDHPVDLLCFTLRYGPSAGA